MSANPFWEFSLELYERPGIADACIALQDSAGLDVNLLLFCIWCAAEGPGRLPSQELAAAAAAVRDWQDGVIGPLRTARRAAKPAGGPGLFATAFRRDLAATELSAERVEQWLLFEQVAERARARRGAPEGVAAACGNLGDYLKSAGADAAAARPRLEVLLAGCWPGIDGGELRAATQRMG